MMKTFLMILLLAFTGLTFAEEIHPRVMEMEIMLSKEAEGFLLRRYPEEPFGVTVHVEALRRDTYKEDSEKLPYLNSEEEIVDEWDSDLPLVALFSRIKKATIKIDARKDLTDETVKEISDKLINYLKLVPGRDAVEITRTIKPVEKAKDYSNYYFATAFGFAFLVGLFFVTRFGIKKEAAPAASGGGAMPMAAPSYSSGSSKGKSELTGSKFLSDATRLKGDINFTDTLKTIDILRQKITSLTSQSNFPSLNDMIVFEELAMQSPESFGALLFEFPKEIQHKIFFRGRSNLWFKALANPGTISIDCYMAVESMLRKKQMNSNEVWEDVLIQLWRLDTESVTFLKKIKYEHAMALLSGMPKNISVPLAKKAFPGNWGAILTTTDKTETNIDNTQLNDYLQTSLTMKPYFSFRNADEFKKESEIIKFVRYASITDEEEIYETLGESSTIKDLRPPFYKMFKEDKDYLGEFIPSFNFNDWALALSNAPRDYVKFIQKHLDDKKKYLLSNALKQIENGEDQVFQQANKREEIGRAYEAFSFKKNQVTQAQEQVAKESPKTGLDESILNEIVKDNNGVSSDNVKPLKKVKDKNKKAA